MIDLTPKVKKWLSLAGKVLLVVVIAGGIVWFTLVNPYLIRQEKKRFESAAASLQQLSEEIQAKIGKADEVSQSKTCGYSSAKFSKGFLSCSVKNQLKYPGKNLNDSNEILSLVSGYIGGTLYAGIYGENQTSFLDIPRAEQSFSQEFYKSEIRCGIEYSFTDAAKFKASHPDKLSGFVINLNCGGPARAEHYPSDN